jgi:hypothetical protein
MLIRLAPKIAAWLMSGAPLGDDLAEVSIVLQRYNVSANCFADEYA